MKRILFVVVFLGLIPVLGIPQETPPPIIDVHLHSLPADYMGPPPLAFCLPTVQWPAHDPRRPYSELFRRWEKNPTEVDPYCNNPIWSPETDEELMNKTIEILVRRNIIGITSGPLVERYYEEAPDRIIPGLMFAIGANPPPVDSVRKWFENGKYAVMAEITNQYYGVTPDDPRFEPYLELAEEMDIPVGIHDGPGPPGVAHLWAKNYRGRLHSPLLYEEILMKHPILRLYLMHAGWPMIDDLLALMWTHPQVYVGVGVISFALPRSGFHSYLRRIVEAGFGNRVMFGSDQMVWPEAIEYAIESIQTADFLSEKQKRDILYNNAARFFRLNEKNISQKSGLLLQK